jgi:ketosteroid isomerase-like protein
LAQAEIIRGGTMSSQASKTIDTASLARFAALLDRQDILDCVTRISRAIDRFDRDLFLSGYHADAVIDAGGFVGDPGKVYDGGAALHEQGQSTTLHHLTNHSCELDGDVAHAETYWQYVGRNRDGSNWVAGGRYVDRLERRDDVWKVAFRCTLLEWSGSIPESNVPLFENIADAHVNGVSSRNKGDPSYRRPLINQRQVRFPDDPRALSAPRR